MLNSDFVKDVKKVLKKEKLAPKNIVLELTEAIWLGTWIY